MQKSVVEKEVVYAEFFFRPLSLEHTWLVYRSNPQVHASAAIADVFSNEMNITRIRSNGAYWAESSVVSTVEDAIMFLQALNQGKIIRKDTLLLMRHWRPLWNTPFQYRYGTSRILLHSNQPPGAGYL